MSTKDIFKLFVHSTNKNKTNIISFLDSEIKLVTINAPISQVHIEFHHLMQYEIELMLPTIYGPILYIYYK